MASLNRPSWQVMDSGVLPGHENMTIDKWALEEMDDGLLRIPKIRFFQWDKPTISYGYLMEESKVQEWSRTNGKVDFVQRPTAGGAVFHQETDLSLSLLWPRNERYFPQNPRAAYAAIHHRVQNALTAISSSRSLSLFEGRQKNCAGTLANINETPVHFSICFDTPVCNDIMDAGRKVVGGAMRLTKRSILYQGNILLEGTEKLKEVKEKIAAQIIGDSTF